MSLGIRARKFVELGLLVLVCLGLSGNAHGAPPAKSTKMPFATMAEVLAALGKPDAIVYASGRRDFDDINSNVVALIYRKPRKQEFFISPTGIVVPGDGFLPYIVPANGPDRPAARQRETVAEVCKRLGNPDEVWGVPKDWLRDTPMAVQLTFERAKRRYRISKNGYVLDSFEISDDVKGWLGKNVAEVFRNLGKPDMLVPPSFYSRKCEEPCKSPAPALVMVYRSFRSRNWYVTADGKVYSIANDKGESIRMPRLYSDVPEPKHGESIADWVNRRGRPDRIEAVPFPKVDHFGHGIIVLTYRGLDQRFCFSEDGYLLENQGACPADL